MLKLPVIMAPCLFGNKVNSEYLKKSIMEKEFSYTEDTIQVFQYLVEKKEVRINRIGELTGKELEDLGKKLGLVHSKKSLELIKIDIINLSKIFLGGQVILQNSFD